MPDIDSYIRKRIIRNRKEVKDPLIFCPFRFDITIEENIIDCRKYCGYLFPEWLESNKVAFHSNGQITKGVPHPCNLLGRKKVINAMKEKFKDLYERE